MDTMKALVLTDYLHLEYKDVPVPEIHDNEVLVNVKACAICGSDFHGWDGGSGRRQPPVIMGHEAAGVISRVGKNVKKWKVGDRVTFDSTVYCAKCWFCQHGMINLCEDRMVLGVSCDEYNRDGAMAEYVAIPEHILYKLPDEVSFVQASCVEPLSVIVHAVSISNMKPGHRCVVAGAGVMGLLLLQVLKAAGATEVIVADLIQSRLDYAKKLGATRVVKTDEEDLRTVVLEMTNGRGADLAFECCGIQPTLDLAVNSVRLGGNVVMIGNLAKNVEIPMQKCVTQQIDIQGSCASAGEYDICLDLMAKKLVNTDAVISTVAPLKDGAKWFEKLYKPGSGLYKVVLEP